MLELLGLVLPPAIDFLNKHVADSKLRFVVSVAVCLLVAGAIKLYEGKLNLNSVPEFLASAGIVFTEAQAVYKLFYEKSRLQTAIRK